MSSILLILLKICKNHRNIDIKAIERVGIKSLNFSKAILLLEELIICKSKNPSDEKARGIGDKGKTDRNKEWISLKRLHEASGMFTLINLTLDSTGSQNLMLDEFLIIEEDPNQNAYTIREANVGESGNQIEKKKLAQVYLEQLEDSDKFDNL